LSDFSAVFSSSLSLLFPSEQVEQQDPEPDPDPDSEDIDSSLDSEFDSDSESFSESPSDSSPSITVPEFRLLLVLFPV